MTRRGRAQHRVDLSAKALIAACKQFGVRFAAADGTYDGIIWVPSTGQLEVVDFKSAGGTLTPGQVKLVAAGWPLRFVSDVEQLQALVHR